MATQREEDEVMETGIIPVHHHMEPEVIEEEEEEEEEEDQNWDDWEAEDEAVEDASASETQLCCLFCDYCHNSCSSLFEHCASVHRFDFGEIKRALSLDFYQCFKLINYVRSQVSENKCWSCGMVCRSKEELQNHLHKSTNFEHNVLPWNDDKYFNPFLQDDALLYSFGEEDEDEDGDTMSVDKEELETYLSQIESINIHDIGVSDKYASKFMIPRENGGKEVVCTLDKDVKEISPERVILNGASNETGGILSYRNWKNEICTASSSEIAANEIKNINKNYFGAYSSYGIHREMISDKARTDTYRQAILENPSLLRNAVVMDVGCGTGILSLFAAQAGASKVIAVEASEKMAAVATQVAKDNGLLLIRSKISKNGVIEVVPCMVEELYNADQIQPHSIDLLLSEWMGYCLLYESMLSSVLFARDQWLKPGGAILPDTATMFVAGFGRGGTSLPFWENVYGFNMSCIGQEIVEDASRFPIIDIIDGSNIITTTEILQTFDLVTMQTKDMDFTAEVELDTKLVAPAPSINSTCTKLEITWCYGVVLWFETGFTKRFCREKPTVLSTSPYDPSTHWSQTVLTFREPIAMGSSMGSQKLAAVGTNECPSARIQSRISVVRATQHRAIDISMELTAIGHDGRRRSWPAQMFNLK
ncbi:probable protein arginine N-methyltransferase 3 [Henckelia pumila]|uniref:probable protein arginine N-methyltransferase 3 n=1 Tax=Henckelia pumila TaxID=405737 RepID=UPI003C6E8E0A